MYATTTRTAARMFIFMIVVVYALAYVFRWLYLTYYIASATVLTDVNPDWNAITSAGFNSAFMICSLAFGLFFLSTLTLKHTSGGVRRVDYPAPSDALTAFVVVVVGVTLVLRWRYGAVLGEQSTELPYGLGTILYRSQADLIPGLLLLMAEAAWVSGAKHRYIFWIVALALFDLAISAITTSKAGLIFFAVEILSLMYLTEQRILARPWRLALLAAAGIAVFIISAQLRARALLGTDAQIFSSISHGNVIETVLEVIGMIANRLPGTEGLALHCGYTCRGLPSFIVPNFSGEAGRYYTQNVINVGNDFDFRSPGYIGGSVIIAGLWGGILLAVGFLRFVLASLRAGDRFGLSASTKIVISFGAFRFILEGVWGWQDVASAAASALLVEIAARQMTARKIATLATS